MLRVKIEPPSTEAGEFADYVRRCLRRQPFFETGPMPVVFVLEDDAYLALTCTHAPRWALDDNVLRFLERQHRMDGLCGFEHGEDAQREAEADALVIDLLRELESKRSQACFTLATPKGMG